MGVFCDGYGTLIIGTDGVNRRHEQGLFWCSLLVRATLDDLDRTLLSFDQEAEPSADSGSCEKTSW